VVSRERPDRAQLILVGSVLIAVTIVSSVVLLNSIHESPGVYTERDTRSAVEAASATGQLKDGLERAFLVNSSVDSYAEPLPYAEGDNFGALVAEYASRYSNVTTVSSVGVVDVTLIGMERGALARQNATLVGSDYRDTTFGDAEVGHGPASYREYPDDTVIEDAEKIPRLSLYVNETSPSPAELELLGSGGSTVSMEISDSGVDIVRGGTTVSDCALSDFQGIEIDVVDGVGAVSTGQDYCGNLTFGATLTPPLDVEFSDGDEAKGTYAISGVDAVAGGADTSVPHRRFIDCGTPNCVVNPVFAVEYTDPDIQFNSTVGLYNRSRP